jgi:enoyl-CoA hydratase
MNDFCNILSEKIYSNKIWIITINREKSANAIDRKTAEELSQVFKKFDSDKESCIAIITGSGKHFCAGADLKSVAQEERSGMSPTEGQKNQSKFIRLEIEGDAPLGITRMTLNKPVIAAINGHAVAGGMEIILWADLRVTYNECEMGIFCRRFGVPLIDGGTLRLPKLIGMSRAMDLILTGRALSGKEGYKIGLINRLVKTREQVMPKAIELAKELCQLPQTCLRNDRMSLINNVFNMNYEQLIKNEFKFGLNSILSGESKNGAMKFIEGEGKKGKPLIPKF